MLIIPAVTVLILVQQTDREASKKTLFNLADDAKSAFPQMKMKRRKSNGYSYSLLYVAVSRNKMLKFAHNNNLFLTTKTVSDAVTAKQL